MKSDANFHHAFDQVTGSNPNNLAVISFSMIQKSFFYTDSRPMSCLSGRKDDFCGQTSSLIRKNIQLNSIRVESQIMVRLGIFRFTKRVFTRLGESKVL